MRIMGPAVGAMLAAAMAIQPAAAQQAGGAPLTPAGGWDVDYGDSLCTLSRDFRGPAGPVSLGFAPLTGGGELKILAVGLPGSERSGKGRAIITANPDEPMVHDFYSSSESKSGRAMMMIRGRRGDLEHFRSASVLTIEVKGQPVRFAVPGIAAALKALDACETDLAKSWGYDPATTANPAKALDRGHWLNNDDYPKTALEQSQAGETDFRLTVGTDGKPTGCIVILHSGSAALDDRTCAAMMRRARFTPAVGVDGKPVPGIYSEAAMWELAPGY